MEYITIQKNLKSSPRKLRLVAAMVRKMTPAQAVLQLRFTNTAAAPLLAKAIKTVMANAGNAEGLLFKSIEINDGLRMRRMRVGTAGRGRGRPYKKRLAHVKIVLTDDVVVTNDKSLESRVKKSGAKMEKDINKVVEENTKPVEEEAKAEETAVVETNEATETKEEKIKE